MLIVPLCRNNHSQVQGQRLITGSRFRLAPTAGIGGAQRGALATVRRFNATLSAKGYVWFWPKIAAALTSKHHWLVIACDSCDTVVDLDLRVKPRDPKASIRVALRDVQCPRCNGHGRPRIIALAGHPSLMLTLKGV